MRIRHWVLCAAALSLGLTGGRQAFAQGRLYFSGQFGAGNTYNLYELKGAGDINVAAGARLGRYQVLNGTNLSFSTGDAQTMRAAHNSAATTLETISGTNKPAHLTAFSGPTAAAENFFAATHISFINNSAWIGLTDDEFFGGGESRGELATGDPSAPQNGCGAACDDEALKGFAGQPGSGVNDGVGWQWTNGEPYDYRNWNGGEPNDYAQVSAQTPGDGEDATELLPGGLWNDNADGDGVEANATRPYIYEYETRSATPLTGANILQLSANAEPTPGNKGGNGFMAVREVHSTATVSGNSGTLALLYGQLPQDAEVNYNAPVLALQNAANPSGGEFAASGDFGLNTVPALAGTDINNFALRAHGYLTIPEGQGGQYTFDVNTDDSGELYIYGKTFESVTNGSITPYGSLAYLADRDNSNTLGVITLPPGEYEFEYVMNENGGGATAEFSAAKGAHTAFSLDHFSLIGGNPTAVVYPGGTTPKVAGDFTIKEVLRLDVGSGDLNTLADAKALLNSPDGNDLIFNGTSATVNHSDETTNGTASGRFADDSNFLNDTFNTPPDFDDNDFVFNAKAQVVITTAGDYTFGFDSDDGAEIVLQGANFTSAFGPGVASGDHLTADLLTGSSLSAAWTHMEPGTYNLEYTMFERGGGSFAELFVAPGRQPAFSLQTFSLLTTTTRTVPGFTKAGALQLGDGIVEGGQEGDTDGDGDVDLTDLNNVRNNFGGSGLGDTDDDNDVDLDDLNSVRNNFGASGSNSVPEPSSLALIGLGLAGLFGIRKFRK